MGGNIPAPFLSQMVPIINISYRVGPLGPPAGVGYTPPPTPIWPIWATDRVKGANPGNLTQKGHPDRWGGPQGPPGGFGGVF